jgi:TPP-dependent pyruvate/acetoin dehydrogenase alpha subunit
MDPDLLYLYKQMLRSRLFEEAVAHLWTEGLISGEMHLGTGEEAINAGVVDHLRDGDGMALDHRGTAAMLMRGVEPVKLLREFLGEADGLCAGMGGHMHMYSKEHLVASSGIVGASGPAAVGFAMAAQILRPGSLAVAFFGEGATNQGMLMEALNLAVVWQLPVIFVCKDDGWSITTESSRVHSRDLSDRARSFGMPAEEVDGLDIRAVWFAAQEAVQRARNGNGPSFLHARCVHLEAHFLGYLPLRFIRSPVKYLPWESLHLTNSILQKGGAGLKDRFDGLGLILEMLIRTYRSQQAAKRDDPLLKARQSSGVGELILQETESSVAQEISGVIELALTPESRPEVAS